MALDIPNYSLDVQAPFQAALAGYQGGAAIRQDQQAQVQQQQQVAAQQQQQQVLASLLQKPDATADDYSRAVLLIPGLKDQLKQSWEVKNAAQQQATLSDASQWGAAIANGQPDLASKLMNLRADSMEQAAGAATPESKALRAKAQVVTAHPEFGLGIIQALLSANPDGEKTANALKTLGAEARARQQAPADLQKKEADASKATSEAQVAAGTVPAALEKPTLDNQETREKIETARTQRRVADFNVQIAQANSETERGRLVLERDKVVAEQGQKAQAKSTAAADQMVTLNQAQDTLNQIKAHPALEGWFTGPGTVVGRQLGWVPGTNRTDLNALIDTFKSQQFLSSLAKLKEGGPSGLGGLTEAEGSRLVDAIGKLDPNMSAGAFKNTLGVIGKTLDQAQSRLTTAGNLPTTGGAVIMQHPTYGVVSESTVNRLMREHPGSTREQVVQFLQSSGGK